MITAHQSPEKAYQKYAWVILFVLGVLLVLNILIVAAFVSGGNDFKADTGATWNEFAAAYPGIAAAYVLEQRLAYTGFASVALFALVIAYFGFRQGYRWAWFAMWLLPITLVLMAMLLFLSRRPDIGAFYGGLTLVAVIGLLLPIRKFFPRQS